MSYQSLIENHFGQREKNEPDLLRAHKSVLELNSWGAPHEMMNNLMLQ